MIHGRLQTRAGDVRVDKGVEKELLDLPMKRRKEGQEIESLPIGTLTDVR